MGEGKGEGKGRKAPPTFSSIDEWLKEDQEVCPVAMPVKLNVFTARIAASIMKHLWESIEIHRMILFDLFP